MSIQFSLLVPLGKSKENYINYVDLCSDFFKLLLNFLKNSKSVIWSLYYILIRKVIAHRDSRAEFGNSKNWPAQFKKERLINWFYRTCWFGQSYQIAWFYHIGQLNSFYQIDQFFRNRFYYQICWFSWFYRSYQIGQFSHFFNLQVFVAFLLFVWKN